MSLDKLNQLYRAVILEHAANPHHHYAVPMLLIKRRSIIQPVVPQ